MALTDTFDSARSNFVLNATQVALAQKETENAPTFEGGTASSKKIPLFVPDDEDQVDDVITVVQETITSEPYDEPMSTDDTNISSITKETPTSAPSSLKEPLLPQKRPRSISPDFVPDGAENRAVIPSNKTPSGPSSPAHAPEPSNSQRLAGPGRTPARVEQILSENTSRTGRAVQMVLDTSGASWNLKPGQEGPPRKRQAPGDVGGSSSGKNARANMRARLAGFAREGSRVVQDAETEHDSESSEDGESTEQNAEDEERKPSPQKMQVDADEPEARGDGGSSTDVVDETMVIDSSESEDEPSKAPNDISRAAATAPSPTPPQADDDFTSNDDLLQDSTSDGTQSSSAVAAGPPSPPIVSGVQTEIVRTAVGDAPPIAFDLERTTKAWSTYLKHGSTAQAPQPAPRSSEFEGADLRADDENATAALSRVLSKADFNLMNVVGQFNRGFIVAHLCKGGGGEGATDDLFIVDQHAADEKYNFETLQATTRLESQRLFSCVTAFALISSDLMKGLGTSTYIGRACWS